MALFSRKMLVYCRKKWPIDLLHNQQYAHPEVFQDVTVGDNANCGTSGFPATEGWDPVTGLG